MRPDAGGRDEIHVDGLPFADWAAEQRAPGGIGLGWSIAKQVVLTLRPSCRSPSCKLAIERFARHAQFRRHVLPVAFFRQGVTFIEPGIQPLGHSGQRPDFRTHPRRLNRPGKHGRPGQYEVRILTQGHDEGMRTASPG